MGLLETLTRTKERTRELALNRVEAESTLAVATRIADESMDFCRRHDVEPPVGREKLLDDQILFLVHGQKQFDADIVDGWNVRHQLRFRIHRKGPGLGGAYHE